MANQYDTSKLQSSRPGKTRETGGKEAPAGLWRHPESGQEAITLEDPLFGNAQSQAFLRAGYEFIRPAREGEVKSLPELHLEARDASDVKGLSARLDKLENVAKDNEELGEQNKSLAAEVEDLKKQLAEKAEAEKKAAKEAKKTEKQEKKQAEEDRKHVEEAGKATTSTAQEQSGEHAKAAGQVSGGAQAEEEEAARAQTPTKSRSNTKEEGK